MTRTPTPTHFAEKIALMGRREKRRFLLSRRGFLSHCARVAERAPNTVNVVYWGKGTSQYVEGIIDEEMAKPWPPEVQGAVT